MDAAVTVTDLRCDAAQGFLFSEPRPAAELTGWLRTAMACAPAVGA